MKNLKLLLVTLVLILGMNSFAENLINKKNFDSSLNQRINYINKFYKEVKKLDKVSQLEKVNSFFNKHIKYTSDKKLYGKLNYIATLNETVRSMKGDCDDYVTAKAEVLEKLGFHNQKLLYSTERGVRHVKLLVVHNKTVYVLDNLNKRFRQLTVKELKKPKNKIYSAGLYLKLKDIKSRNKKPLLKS